LERLRLLTRRSRLAMIQAQQVAAAVGQLDSTLTVEIVGISSKGDEDNKRRLDRFSSPGIFTKALEDALLEGAGDAAVHSAKDVPTAVDERFELAAYLPRSDPRDAIVFGPTLWQEASSANRRDRADKGHKAALAEQLAGKARHMRRLEDPFESVSPLDVPLKPASLVATGSPRRRSMLSFYRPDLSFVDLRGNMETRLSKLGEVDAVVASAAALDRLDVTATQEGKGFDVVRLDPFLFVPAAGQGAIVVETLKESRFADLFQALDDPDTSTAVAFERACLAGFGAGCSVPMGAFACVVGGETMLVAAACSLSGGRLIKMSRRLEEVEAARELGRSLAELVGGSVEVSVSER
jgi:hydroxymethylbilane synthase